LKIELLKGEKRISRKKGKGVETVVHMPKPLERAGPTPKRRRHLKGRK